MKRNLLAASVLCTLTVCGAAQAADIEVYGLIDVALGYAHKDDGEETTSDFQVKSGPSQQSRVGIRGSEALGNGWKVGFVLENGFDVDTGALGNQGRLFGREAQVNLSGPYGTVYFGRMGALMSGLGTTGIFGGTVSAFPSAKSTDVPNHKAVMGGVFAQHDNTITYVSPALSGFQVHAQYSMSRNTTVRDGRENTSAVDRYSALGVTYAGGPLKAVVIVDQLNYAKGTANNPNDAYTVSLGGNYDFGPVRLYAAMQHFKHAKPTVDYYNTHVAETGMAYGSGYGGIVSTNIPLGSHTLKFGAGYMTMESDVDSGNDLDRWVAIAGYQYRLSKRTSFYATAGYGEDSYSKSGASNGSVAAVESGIVHRF